MWSLKTISLRKQSGPLGGIREAADDSSKLLPLHSLHPTLYIPLHCTAHSTPHCIAFHTLHHTVLHCTLYIPLYWTAHSIPHCIALHTLHPTEYSTSQCTLYILLTLLKILNIHSLSSDLWCRQNLDLSQGMTNECLTNWNLCWLAFTV